MLSTQQALGSGSAQKTAGSSQQKSSAQQVAGSAQKIVISAQKIVTAQKTAGSINLNKVSSQLRTASCWQSTADSWLSLSTANCEVMQAQKITLSAQQTVGWGSAQKMAVLAQQKSSAQQAAGESIMMHSPCCDNDESDRNHAKHHHKCELNKVCVCQNCATKATHFLHANGIFQSCLMPLPHPNLFCPCELVHDCKPTQLLSMKHPPPQEAKVHPICQWQCQFGRQCAWAQATGTHLSQGNHMPTNNAPEQTPTWIPSLLSSHNFCQWVCQVCLPIVLFNSWDSCCCCLSCCMVINHIVLLLWGRLWHACILDQASVVTKHICHTFNWCAETPKLTSQSNNQLLTNLQCNKLTAKCCWLHHVLLLTAPDNWCIADKQCDTCVQTMSHNVTSIVSIHKSWHVCQISSRFRHLQINLLLNIPTKLFPVSVTAENWLINLQWLQVECDSSHIQMFLQVSKHMTQSFEMFFPQICLALWQEWDLRQDVNVSKLNCPMANPNQLQVTRQQLQSQLFCDVQLWSFAGKGFFTLLLRACPLPSSFNKSSTAQTAFLSQVLGNCD